MRPADGAGVIAPQTAPLTAPQTAPQAAPRIARQAGPQAGPSPTGTGSAPGTFGELLQGATAHEQLDFLVTLPIDRGATAVFTAGPERAGVSVFPAHKHRARHLAELMLSEYGFGGGGHLHLRGELPEGKGLASSSADLTATARAVARALGLQAGPETVEHFLRRIEPTDGVMYPGIVSYYHREVRLRERIGTLPPLTIVGVEEGGVVDTIEFNRRPKDFSRAERLEYEDLLARVTHAVRGGDLRAVGEVATRSAVMNERLRPKRLLRQMIAISRDVDALGVAVAHSGTALGVLIARSDPEYTRKASEARDRAARLAGAATLYHSCRQPAS
ncbi:GHMP family kinase ATP-binding protein [Streptomyces lavendofoliae]|uniref:Kinase n=1 Tax=Streptomyces lavendofoliae TaxID=67314 RepID=A0A918HZA4_9ACTN|nr:kinase [Streptomyces lavendofoliae]GGU46654.1 kinase [Streptomyces lavendofoliae]